MEGGQNKQGRNFLRRRHAMDSPLTGQSGWNNTLQEHKSSIAFQTMRNLTTTLSILQETFVNKPYNIPIKRQSYQYPFCSLQRWSVNLVCFHSTQTDLSWAPGYITECSKQLRAKPWGHLALAGEQNVNTLSGRLCRPDAVASTSAPLVAISIIASVGAFAHDNLQVPLLRAKPVPDKSGGIVAKRLHKGVLGLRGGDCLHKARQLFVQAAYLLEHVQVLWVVDQLLEAGSQRVVDCDLHIIDCRLRILVELLVDADGVR